MRYDDFIDAVSGRMGVAVDKAEDLTYATLRTLAERITGGEARDLAAQLPRPLRDLLIPSAEPAEAFDLGEFIRRVSERAGVNAAEAAAGTQAVFATLRKAVTGGEFHDILTQLPTEFREALTTPA
jgi:uncharacterized protein (DUF2267 family)